MRQLLVPQNVLTETWCAFQEGARARVESTVRWSSPAALAKSDLSVVTTVVSPGQRVSQAYFEIPYDATRTMGQTLREHGLVNVAQVHTHPGSWVGHSSWDDSHAYSSRDSALSIIWPNYGSTLPSIDDWGVHECRAGRWVRLSASIARQRIKIVPSVMQLRGPLVIVDAPCEGEFESDAE
jgi:proteasome lid subunit RPN8/RPN11